MIDEIFDRQYQAGRDELHNGSDRLVQRVAGVVASTFKAVHRVQFAAPWAKNKGARC